MADNDHDASKCNLAADQCPVCAGAETHPGKVYDWMTNPPE